MPHWLIKAGLQHGVSLLPRPQFWNGLFQKYLSRSLEMNAARFGDKLRECHRHFREFDTRRGSTQKDFNALELGTGWFPTLPLGLYLCGAHEIWTVDIDPNLQSDRLRVLLDFFRDFARTGRLQEFLPASRPDRIRQLESLRSSAADLLPEKWLAQLKIHVLVQDAQHLELPSRSVDLIFSSGVLEYISEPVLKNILVEFHRLCSPDAVMTHRINLVDHFSYFDKRLTPFNYLRFTERQWRRFNNRLVWQSRLRIPEYRRLLTEAGFDIVSEKNERGAPEQLDRVALAPEFRKYSRDDLLVLQSFIVARLRQGKPAASGIDPGQSLDEND